MAQARWIRRLCLWRGGDGSVPERSYAFLKKPTHGTVPGELGTLLRREGIYSSYLSRWRRARDRGQFDGLRPGKRGRKPLSDAAVAREIVRLQRENERLQARLEQAEAIIDVQKKLSQLLGPRVKQDESNGRP